jgi:putative membrane protein
LSRGDIAQQRIRQHHEKLPEAVHIATTLRVNSEKERIPMFWGFGHGFMFMLPFLLLGKIFWIVILALLIACVIRWASRRRRHAPYYNWPYHQYGTPPAQPSALDILRQRYARGEIDATTFDQMRERLEATNGPRQQ